jgi:hypothetical protein
MPITLLPSRVCSRHPEHPGLSRAMHARATGSKFGVGICSRSFNAALLFRYQLHNCQMPALQLLPHMNLSEINSVFECRTASTPAISFSSYPEPVLASCPGRRMDRGRYAATPESAALGTLQE